MSLKSIGGGGVELRFEGISFISGHPDERYEGGQLFGELLYEWLLINITNCYVLKADAT